MARFEVVLCPPRQFFPLLWSELELPPRIRAHTVGPHRAPKHPAPTDLNRTAVCAIKTILPDSSQQWSAMPECLELGLAHGARIPPAMLIFTDALERGEFGLGARSGVAIGIDQLVPVHKLAPIAQE